MYPTSYAFVVTFHPILMLDKIFLVGSFNHTSEQLNDISYLPNEMLNVFDPVTGKQLRDCEKAVFDNKIEIFAD